MKILFIGHDAHRAGAQILLMQLIRWIKSNRKDIEFELILSREGDLLNDYESICAVRIFRYNSTNRSLKSRLKRILKRKLLLSNLSRKKFDLIYSNTIVNGEILNVVKKLEIPIITHVHELDYWISRTGDRNLEYVKNVSSRYIAASDSVKKCLIKYNFEEHLITTINEFIVVDTLGKEKRSLKNKLTLSEDSIIVGASGSEAWRKGKDWFIPLAIDILSRRIDKEIHFVWIGGELSYELQNDLDKSGYTNKIHFVPHLPNANQYFHEFTVFAMLSREDPFPVVNLEAAGLGVPIVCFENSGGTPELIAKGCGFVAPYGNLHEFADKICFLIENDKLRNDISTKSIEVIATNYDISIIVNKIIDIIHKEINF